MANQIRDRRRAAGLTQQQLADLAHASRSTVKLLEAGYAPATSATRERVELALAALEDSSGQRSGSSQGADGVRITRTAGADTESARCDALQSERTVPS
jgi:transcriptional regulator with XRE-family HTH domain